MIQLTKNYKQEMREFIRDWFNLLAEGKLKEASEQIDEPNKYGIKWTPELIVQTVNETFSPDTIFYSYFPEGPKFTSPDKLKENPSTFTCIVYDNDKGYWLEHDMPLNNEWSDLTAQFEFLKREDGYAVILHDLIVM